MAMDPRHIFAATTPIFNEWIVCGSKGFLLAIWGAKETEEYRIVILKKGRSILGVQ